MQPTIGRKRIERCVDARTSESRADKAAERGAGKSQKEPGMSSVAPRCAKGDAYATYPPRKARLRSRCPGKGAYGAI